jgi:hypothetical protein
VFESNSRVELNRKVQITLAVILITLACGFFVITKFSSPNKDSVGGIYRNGCCSDIVIKQDYLSYRGKSLNFELVNMKFGLTGYVNARFMSDGMQDSGEPTAITFSNKSGHFTLSLPVDRHEYTFRRIRSFQMNR